jgi:hypothetical protein
VAGEDVASGDLAGEDVASGDLASGDGAGEDVAGEDVAGEDVAKFAALGAAPRIVGCMDADGLAVGVPGFSMAAAVTVLASAPITEMSMNFCIANPSICRRHHPASA